MIKNILCGDVTALTNPPKDIIIGMNSELGDLSALGCQIFRDQLPRSELIDLGTVLSFRYDKERMVHAIICHHLGNGGWRNANNYVRVALDHLWLTCGYRQFGIVQIGKGRVGIRDGANSIQITEAIASSYLHVDLYIHDDQVAVEEQEASGRVLHFLEGWNQTKGNLVATAA
ncbi:MAG: hypothetical protein WCF92_00840 [bacterium]